jgi:hypothetical protein
VCVGCTERTLVVNIVRYTFDCLRSASVSALQTVFSNSSYESTSKWETSQTVGARLAAASVTKRPLHYLYPEQQFRRL